VYIERAFGNVTCTVGTLLKLAFTTARALVCPVPAATRSVGLTIPPTALKLIVPGGRLAFVAVLKFWTTDGLSV
jgi:hypothetical protein